MQRREASQREERYIAYALRCKVFDEDIIAPLGHVVEILHADYLRNCLGLGQLLRTNVTQAQVTNESLLLEFGEHGQRFRDGSLGWPHDSSNPKIDDIQFVETEVSEIVVNAVDQLLTRKSMDPGFVFTSASAYLGDNHQAIRIGMERLLYDLIGHMRTVKVAGVDVIHAGLNGLSQYSDCSLDVAGRSPDLRACKLHRAIAHAVYGHRGAGERETAAKVYLHFHFLSLLLSVQSNQIIVFSWIG